MALVFEIIKGPGEGKRFLLKDGVTIGRKNTTVLLEDANVSGQHARIEDRQGALFLLDSGSANGLKVRGKKLREVPLKPGTTVKLGRTTLQVIEADDGAPALAGALSWSEKIISVVERLKVALDEKSGDFVQTMKPFSPPLEFKFEKGPQTGQNWVIGFGPRFVGSSVVDLKIQDPQSPGVCFSVRPGPHGPLLRTDHPDIVKVNGESRDVETLKNGDTIDILGTRIAVLIEVEQTP